MTAGRIRRRSCSDPDADRARDQSCCRDAAGRRQGFQRSHQRQERPCAGRRPRNGQGGDRGRARRAQRNDLTAMGRRRARDCRQAGARRRRRLLARAKSDPGFPFEPEVIAALKTFRKDRPADWQRLRSRLKAELENPSFGARSRDEGQRRRRRPGDGLPGRPLRFEDIEPWHEPVDGAALLTDIAATIGCYVVAARISVTPRRSASSSPTVTTSATTRRSSSSCRRSGDAASGGFWRWSSAWRASLWSRRR